MTKPSLNDAAWNALFEKHQVLASLGANGSCTLTADSIKEFREPRLMTKFDHSHQLPEVFRQNGIALLPISRGSYTLGRFDIFHTLEARETPVKSVTFPTHFETLDFNHISSETAAINCAYLSGILEDFLGETVTPTVSGRMSSDRFSFAVSRRQTTSHQLNVDRAQIEIDGGFEGTQCFALVEAKNHLSDDFLIRQLYYPYRKWHSIISKQVRNLFLTYSNGVFELREYKFLQLTDYNAIELVKCKKYTLFNETLNSQTLQAMIARAAPDLEPRDTPFPQANAFDRVINLCELLANDEKVTKQDITANYGFNSRQTDYYLNACKYLGLLAVVKSENAISLSQQGHAIFQQPTSLHTKLFIEQILKRPTFREALALYLFQSSPPIDEQIVQIMLNARLGEQYNLETLFRRASTVRAWLNWIVSQIEP